MTAHTMSARTMLALGILSIASIAFADMPSREESERQARIIARLNEAVTAEPNHEKKFALVSESLVDEKNVDCRRAVLNFAATVPSPELETFMLNRLAAEEDAGLRSLAVTTLGRSGSEHCLDTLAKVVATDPTTSLTDGCEVSKSNARRAATFAIAELATRFPKLADKAAAALRDLPVKEGTDSLVDARRQALYQVTHDASLLRPYFEGLKSDDPAARATAVVAFRFLKLKQAPPELTRALKDTDDNVVYCAAMVLGEIRDAQSVEPLMALAADTKRDKFVRDGAVNALGRMRGTAAAAAGLMENLLADPDRFLSDDAAVALYRITGKKAKGFPESYFTD